MNYPINWHRLAPWLAITMGVAGFWIWGGSYTLAPGHIGWVMLGLDTPTHYLGWQFFRHTPWWQWPLGNNPGNGSDAPGTIVFSDSIPLAALFFKALSPLLARDFQYFGLWALSCFLLQAWFARKLMSRLSADVFVQLTGTAFFLGASIFLMRVYLHPALSAQWLLLAGFYLFFDPRFRARAWFVLLCVAVLVHAYLFVMLVALWTADLVQRMWRREYGFRSAVIHGLLSTAAVGMLMWTVGYMVRGSTITSPIRSHMDLFFPFWTGIRFFGEWSRIVPATDLDVLAYDGFGYLGLGFIVLMFAALLVGAQRLFRKGVEPGIEAKPTSAWVMVSVSCGTLLAYAVGNKVYLLRRLLFSYPLPPWIDHIYDVFRAAARMMWPAWYLGLFAVFYILLRSMKLRQLRYLLALGLLIQFFDLSRPVLEMRANLAANHTWHSMMQSPAWAELAYRYKHIAYLQPAAVPVELVTFMPSYRSVADFAAINGMSISIAYLARQDQQKLAAARATRTALLERGITEPRTLYVIEDDELWKKLTCAPQSSLRYGTIDGLRIVAPDKLLGPAAMFPGARSSCLLSDLFQL